MTAEWLSWLTSFTELALNGAVNWQVGDGVVGQMGEVEEIIFHGCFWKDRSMRIITVKGLGSQGELVT